MLKNIKISVKLPVVFIVLLAGSISVMSYVSFQSARTSLEAARIANLEGIANLKADKIETFIDHLEKDMRIAQDYYNIRTNLPIVTRLATDRTDPTYLKAKKMLDSQLKAWSNTRSEIVDLMLVSPTGKIVYGTNEAHAEHDLDRPLPDPDGHAFEKGQKRICFTDIFRNHVEDDNFGMLVTAPTHDFDGKFIGVIAIEIDMRPIFEYIQDTAGLGETGETLIGKQVGDEVLFLSQLRHDAGPALTKRAALGGGAAVPMRKAVQGLSGAGIETDYRGKEVIAAWRPILSQKWGMVAKVDSAEAFASATALMWKTVLTTIVTLALAVSLSLYLSRSITRPVKKLSEVAGRISQGELGLRAEIRSKDEIGMLATAFNHMTDGLARSQEELAENVAELKRTEMTVRRSEARQRAVLAASLDPMVTIDAVGIVQSASNSLERVFGWKPDEIVGKNIKMLMPEPFRSKHDGHLENQRRTGKVDFLGITREVEALRKDGSIFPCELSVTNVNLPDTAGPLFMGTIRDITVRTQNEESLRLQGAALESAANAIVITDRDGRIVWTNHAFSQLTGYSREEAVGKDTRILKSGQHETAFFTDLWQTVLAGKVWQGEIVNRRKDGSLYTEESTITPVADEHGEITRFIAVKQDITDRKRAERQLQKAKRQAEEAHAETRQLLEAMSSVLIGLDVEGRVTAWNRTAECTFDIDSENAMGHLLNDLRMGWDYATIARNIATCHAEKRPVRIDEMRFKRPDGTEGFLGITMNPVSADTGRDLGFLLVLTDITEHKILQGQLVQAQKLESVGQLAAGIAHEINTPTQYMGDNTRFLKEGFGDISTVLDKFEKLLQAAKDGSVDEQLVAEVEATLKQTDVEYLREEIPQAIDQSLNGVERVTKIVRAMKEFSHPGGEEKSLINLAEAIETTVTVACNEWKYVAEVVTEFDPELPEVSCLPGELNQVFLNLIVNAAHAIGDTLGDDATENGTITVGTRRDGEWAEIFVRDTGTGIPEDVRARIFDPFFTTKEVGKGTGQGLTIARSVVVDKHGGTLDCKSEQGKGTTFIVRLPIDRERQTQGASEDEEACSNC